MTLQVDELPKSLQQMIADCRNAVANWDPKEDADDPFLKSAHDWTLRLSRGEYEAHVYWECVADDCEEVGDWEGALSAYRRILDISDQLGTTHSKTFSAIAAIQRLCGDDEAALRSYRSASAEVAKHSRVMGRARCINEASQLIRLGRIRRARKLIRRALTSRQGEFVDHLGTARLLIALAKCELACDKLVDAAQSLQIAWEWLDALVQSYADGAESMRQAAGIHLAYATWWSTEAKRRRIAREGDAEIEALRNAIEKVRLCFSPCGWQAPWHDLTLMNLLLQLADAYDRHGMSADSAVSRDESESIFAKRRFPESARWPRHDDWQGKRVAFLRKWREILRRPSKCPRDGKTPP
jgi:tetratricopeptide (TPR) repeat protein